MLFDRADVLSLPSPPTVRRLSLRELQNHLALVIKDPRLSATGERLLEGTVFYTELAIEINIPDRLSHRFLNDSLPRWLDERLRKQRDYELSRDYEPSRHSGVDSHRSPLVYSWLKAARDRGLVYSLTDRVFKIIDTVIIRMNSADVENFVSTIELLAKLVSMSCSRSLPTYQIVWFLHHVEAIVENRCRIDNPLRPPRPTLALEGNAGYRLPRDAFIFFCTKVASEIDSHTMVAVRDSGSGGVSCEVSRGKINVIRVSTLALHHPVHWMVFHGLASSALDNIKLSDIKTQEEYAKLSVETLLTLEDLLSCAKSSQCCDVSLYNALQLMRGHLSMNTETAGLAGVLCRSLRPAISVIGGDLCFFRSLRRPSESIRDTLRRLWFLHGPALILTTQFRHGFTSPPIEVVQALMTRCLLLYTITQKRQVGASNGETEPYWLVAFGDILGELLERQNQGEIDHSDHEIIKLLNCLREDLGIDSERWYVATRLLHKAIVRSCEVSFSWIKDVSAWLSVLETVASSAVNESAKKAAPNSALSGGF